MVTAVTQAQGEGVMSGQKLEREPALGHRADGRACAHHPAAGNAEMTEATGLGVSRLRKSYETHGAARRLAAPRAR